VIAVEAMAPPLVWIFSLASLDNFIALIFTNYQAAGCPVVIGTQGPA
jgi:hypothetical protein